MITRLSQNKIVVDYSPLHQQASKKTNFSINIKYLSTKEYINRLWAKRRVKVRAAYILQDLCISY
ncbi:hypothetical protein C1H46_037391 [Malus baccata]|uniref:Uncharacterized protein n=1 Tax=Malus baccata TaxID=106549 RepID=A0A540KS58_MALBA|nr:hypothetical protein C1H46_037391 [Malus baccata]